MTEFDKTPATPLLLEAELRKLQSVSATGLSAYSDGSGGAHVIYERTLTSDESQDVQEALDAHVAVNALVNYVELIAADSAGYPGLQSQGPAASVHLFIKAKGPVGVIRQDAVYHIFRSPGGTTGVRFEMLDADPSSLLISSLSGNVTYDASPSSGANVNHNFLPKGTGRLQENGANVYKVGGDDVSVADGGTGVSTLADGGIVVGNAAAAVEVVAPGATTQLLVGGGAATNPVWTTATGSGAPVRQTSPSLVTPALGTPSSGNLANCTNATLTAKGVVELATSAEINTGTDTTRAMPVDQFVASNRNVRYFLIRCVEAATDVAVANVVGGDVECPFAGTITEVGAYVDTAGTTGVSTIDINKNGTTILSTKITIDSAEKPSRTAATAPVISVTAIAAGDLITVDVDGVSTTKPKGLTVRIGVRMT